MQLSLGGALFPACQTRKRGTKRKSPTGFGALAACFLPATSTRTYYEFNHPLPGFDDAAVQNKVIPERLIAYKWCLIETMAKKAGLEVTQVVPGFWSRTHKLGITEQDLIVCEAV